MVSLLRVQGMVRPGCTPIYRRQMWKKYRALWPFLYRSSIIRTQKCWSFWNGGSTTNKQKDCKRLSTVAVNHHDYQPSIWTVVINRYDWLLSISIFLTIITLRCFVYYHPFSIILNPLPFLSTLNISQPSVYPFHAARTWQSIIAGHWKHRGRASWCRKQR